MGVSAAEELFRRGAAEIGRVIAGQDEAVAQALVTMLCGGHALIEGVPGVAKTLAVKTLARFLGLDFRRVQGTPDMMPADILGTTVFSPAEDRPAEFQLSSGAGVYAVSAGGRDQPHAAAHAGRAAGAMEERQVTADGERHALDDFFTVFATQNPVEFEGTYPLPEAQLDRFLLKISVGYPTAADERTVLERHHAAHRTCGPGGHCDGVDPVSSCWRGAARDSRCARGAGDLRLPAGAVRRTREWPSISLGASPRASTSLLLVAKALCGARGPRLCGAG